MDEFYQGCIHILSSWICARSILKYARKGRVSLFRLPCAFLDIVIDMLFTSPSSDPRCLTHLELDFREPILDGEVYALTHALRNYPIEVFVLDGILGGYPSIIEGIAKRMPDLLVLTLFLRGGSNQSASTHCIWPKPIRTYAPFFARFTVHTAQTLRMELLILL